MALGIKKSAPQQFPKRKAEKSKDYLAFLHTLPCVVSGRYGVEAAHVNHPSLSHGHYGRGKGTKASDRWALPLSPDCHRLQHAMNERDYWASVGADPYLLCLTIWGLWSEMGDDAQPFAIAIINQQLAARGALREREI